jgi:poly(hydroxyalkanoate) depolymerase family esterase
MNNRFNQGMVKATNLTRSGNLHGATALIQSLLGRDNALAAAPAAEDVIEGSCTLLDDVPPESVRRPGATDARETPKSPRNALSEVLRKIKAGGMPARAPGTPAPLTVPPGASFVSMTYASAQGNRDYRLYTPANASHTPMPLIVMLHGCTQTPEDFAAGTGMNGLAEEYGCLIAYPGQPHGANAQKCWNWFRPEDQVRGRGEPAILAGITQSILGGHSADPARVYIAGLSAGGAAAAIVGNAYPDIFTAVGVHSGLPAGSAQDIPSAFAAMRTGASGKPQRVFVPTIVFHGLSDNTVHPGNGRAVLDRALEVHPQLSQTSTRATAPGGRTYRQTRHDLDCGRSMAEHWEIDGAGHAWSGGQAGGSYTDPNGPDASREMVRFFLQHARA